MKTVEKKRIRLISCGVKGVKIARRGKNNPMAKLADVLVVYFCHVV